MVPTPSGPTARWNFVVAIMASVAVGAMFITAFERLLRGEFLVMSLMLMAMVVLVALVIVNAKAVLKRIS
jgi:hypothetical protein